MWELNYKERWVPKNWCFWNVVLEKTLESPLDSKEIQPVHLKGNQSWLFIGRADAEAETPILWPPDSKNWLFGKDPDAGRDWGQEEKGMTEDEMAEWHHWLNGRESEWTPGDGDGQEGLACCNSWGRKESDTTDRLKSEGYWYKLGLEKAEESEIKLPTFVGSWRKQENSRKKSASPTLTMLRPLTVWITTNCAKFLNRGECQTN